MLAMIYIMPASTSASTCDIHIINTQFKYNRNIHFIKINIETEIVPWEISIILYIYFQSNNISLNQHSNGSCLICIINCLFY